VFNTYVDVAFVLPFSSLEMEKTFVAIADSPSPSCRTAFLPTSNFFR
jgi:hypothetical protein